MIILLHGKDTYRTRAKAEELIDTYIKKNKSKFGLTRLNSKSSFEELEKEMFLVSMFKEKKLIIFSDFFSNAKLKESVLNNIKKFKESENILLLVEDVDILKKEKFHKYFDKVQKFDLLSGAKLREWINNKVIEFGVQIDNEAVEIIVDFVGGDLWRMENELLKLANYSKKISSQNILDMVKSKNEINIFETLDAIAVKNKKKAIVLLRKHMEKGDSPIFILAMIASQIRNIISVKNGEFIKQMNPFVYRKSSSQARNFTMEELKNIYNRIVELDFEIKVGKIDPNISLDILISEI
jgi:DNA polymerase-3 subunit delta